MPLLQEADRSGPAFRPEAVPDMPRPSDPKRQRPPSPSEVNLLRPVVPSHALWRTAILTTMQEMPPESALPGLAATTVSSFRFSDAPARHF